MRSKLGQAIALGLALALLAPLAQADWKTDYDKGIKAMEAGQWDEAQRLFANAAREEGEPAERKPFQGVVRKLYVPHYYAGLASYRLGDCRAALDYWNHAATNAIVAGKGDMKGVQASGIADCNQKIAAASKPTTTPTTTPVVTTPSKPVDKPVVVAPPPKPVETKPVPTPTPAPPSSAPAPAALVNAVESWIGGRYDAVAQLNPASLADGRSKAQGFLLRAAARHTQAELAGGDERQLELARQDVRSARAANSSLSPDETLFSPRFRAFWRATR